MLQESSKSGGLIPPTSATCAILETPQPSTLFAADSLARTFPAPEKVQDSQAPAADCGGSMLVSSKNSAPRGSSSKTSPLSEPVGCELSSATFTRAGTMREWDGISASAVGANHRRDRIFVIAYAHSIVLHAESGRGAGPDRENSIFTKRVGEAGPAARAAGWSAVPETFGVGDGLPAWVDRLRGLGNAVVPQVAEHVGRLIMEAARK